MAPKAYAHVLVLVMENHDFAHLGVAVEFAEGIGAALAPRLVTQKATLERVELEHDNLRHALAWAVSSKPDAALRIVAAIDGFWRMRGYMAEGRRWAEAVLAAAPGDVRLRATVLRWAGTMALHQGDVRVGRPVIERALATFRELGDLRDVAHGLEQLSWVAIDHEGDWSRAERLARESMAIHTELGDEHLASESLSQVAFVRLRRGDELTAQRLMDEAYDYNERHPGEPCPVLRERAGTIALLRGELSLARTRLEEAIAQNRESGQRPFLAAEVGWLGEVALLEGNLEEAERCLAEQLLLAREHGIWIWIRQALLGRAKVAIRRGDVAVARSALDEADRMTRVRGSVVAPEALEARAALLAAESRLEDAARMLGVADALRDGRGEPLPAAYRADSERIRADLAVGLSPEAFGSALAEGRRRPGMVGPDVTAPQQR